MRINTHIALNALMVALTIGGVAFTTTGCAGSRVQRSTGTYIDDKAITAKVKTALFRDPEVSGFDVHVNTFRGNVELNGFVDNQEQKQRAVNIARSVEGVQTVSDNLEVKAAQGAMGAPGSSVNGSSQTYTQPPPANDTYTNPNLNNNVPNTYNNNQNPPPANFNNNGTYNPPPANYNSNGSVDVNNQAASSANRVPAFQDNVQINASNGVATLQGTVRNSKEKYDIEKKVRDIPGISSVNNQLRVLGPQ